ncbi:MAG: YbaK/EbsC family protein [candidate division NC10 bacterium]|nr:YbaK/EbsC family protein [candidate division NC10 bacterium]
MKGPAKGSSSTPASKILTERQIPFRLATFPSQEKDAEEVSRSLKIPLRQVVKTLLLKAPARGFLLVLCPGNRQVDLRRLAQLLQEKQVEMAARDEVHKITGYFIGGVSPLGTRRELPILMDASVLSEKEIAISAGRWGQQILLDPHLLRELLHPRLTVADISQERGPSARTP